MNYKTKCGTVDNLIYSWHSVQSTNPLTLANTYTKNDDWTISTQDAKKLEEYTRDKYNEMAQQEVKKFLDPVYFYTKRIVITDVNIIVPNRVVEVTFSDKTKEKAVCHEDDVFSLETAISVCISKKIMGGSGEYNNAIKRGMKVYKDRIKKEEIEKEEQKRIENKRKKRLERKARKAEKIAAIEREKREKEKEEQIEIQKEAYLRAMLAMKEMERER